MLTLSIPRDDRGDILWTDDLINVLEEHAASGKSAHEIALAMGITKGQVMGKAHREFIKIGTARKQANRDIGSITVTAMYDPFYWRPILDLKPDSCRYPYGSPGDSDFRFCGAKVEREGSSWCEACRTVVYAAVQKKRSDPAEYNQNMRWNAVLGQMMPRGRD